VEQKNRTLVEMGRTMLDEHKTPTHFWVDAISTACYISNQFFMCSILNLIIFEFRFGRKSSISHLRPSGCKCFILKRENLDKFKSHSYDGICLVIHLMIDLTECLILRLTPLLSHTM
jgi:hypothetical protein